MKLCETCRFWGVEEEELNGMRECWLFSDDPSYDRSRPKIIRKPKELAFVSPFAGADGGGLITSPKFGCVQHEDK